MEEPQVSDHVSKQPDYTKRQRVIGTIFYVLLVIASLVTIGGMIYTIADSIMPEGKLDVFLALNLGFQIAIVGGFLAGFFFLIIFFYGLFKRGRKWILRITFKKKEIAEHYKGRVGVQIIAGALLISVIGAIIGIAAAFIIEGITGPSGPWSEFLNSLSVGNWILIGGIGLFILAFLGIFLIYFWKNGYYLILKIMGGLEKDKS